MKKQLLRVKQIADQTFLRAEKTEVLTEDLVNAEKRVDIIKQSFQAAIKKITSCQIDFGSEGSAEKRMKKIPQVALAASMLENGYSFSKNSILGTTLKECASTQAKLGNELLEYYNEVEKSVLKPMSNVLENEIHNINKLRKQLGKLTLDMDSARSRFLAAERHSVQATSGTNVNAAAAKVDKVDTLKDELEEASQKVDQCRDALASEMFALIGKEPHLSEIFVHLHRLQANYHQNALAALEASLPVLERELSNFPQKPVYGCSLEEHLRVTNRQIAHVIEICIYFLLEYGISEEGLLRIAGSASKLKKLKSAFDAGLDIDMVEYIRDPHAVSGALKSYLRELPEPLLTFSLYEEWMSAAKIQDFDQRLQSMWHIVHKLPESNFNNLQYVMKFLSKLHENADVNKMSSQNIAIVMAPNLIWSPVEDGSLGMNMSTANLHNTIIDTLITYADWFFPDAELPNNKNSLTSGRHSKFSEIVTTDSDADDGLLAVGHAEAVTGSPKSAQKYIKKPAAPPPPARKLLYEKSNAVTDLMDISVTLSTDSTNQPNTDSVTKSTQPSLNPNLPPSPSPRTVVRRRSNENIASLNSTVTNKNEKPSVPDKPSYSSYSLDRMLQRSSFSVRHSGPEKMAEYVPRTQRPTVPPPDRPAKPSRFSTIENLSTAVAERCNQTHDVSDENVPSETKQFCTMHELSDVPSIHDSESSVSELTKSQCTPASQAVLKSNSKQNRFDFIIAQTTEKPPERPPRSVSSVQELSERTNPLDSSMSSIKENNEKLPSSPTSPKCEISVSSDVCPSLLMSPDSERPKPPRPQPPPIPYSKPKMNLPENTNL